MYPMYRIGQACQENAKSSTLHTVVKSGYLFHFFHTFFDGAYNTRDMYFSVGDDGMQRPWLQPSEIHVLGLLF